MPQLRPSSAVIVTTYNNLPGLKGCWSSLARQTVRPDAVYVADDGSTPETASFLAGQSPTLALHHCWQEDRGYRRSAVLNQVLREVREDYVVFLDGDEIPHRRFVEDHLAFARPGVAVLGTRCGLLGFDRMFLPAPPSLLQLVRLFLAGRVISDSLAKVVTGKTRCSGLLKGIRFPFHRFAPGPVIETHGGNLAAWRKDLLAVNGFDADFEGWGLEDRDLVRRLQRHGVVPYQLFFRAICYHLEGQRKSVNPRHHDLFSDQRPMACVNGINHNQP